MVAHRGRLVVQGPGKVVADFKGTGDGGSAKGGSLALVFVARGRWQRGVCGISKLRKG